MDDEVDEEAAANAEQSEYDAALVSAACDLVGTLATILGQEFASLFTTFLPAMAQYYVRSPWFRFFSYSSIARPANLLQDNDDNRILLDLKAIDRLRLGLSPKSSTDCELPSPLSPAISTLSSFALFAIPSSRYQAMLLSPSALSFFTRKPISARTTSRSWELCILCLKLRLLEDLRSETMRGIMLSELWHA